MPEDVKPRRRYDSSRRQEQARGTRRAVLDAARDLFVEQGYVTTTIDAIADKAAVSPETIYATFKNKRSLLSAMLDVAIVGDDAPVPLLERDWVRRVRSEPDRERRMKILAHNGRLILERTAAIQDVLRGAAAADPEISSLWEINKRQRLEGQRQLVRIVAGKSGLRKGLTREAAADILFAIGSPDTYRQLVVDRGWSPDRFERWYADTLIRLLL